MVARLAPLASNTLRVLIVLFTVEIAVVSILKYFTSLAEPPEPVVANAFANPFLAIHVIGGVIALLVGPLQFVRRIRERRPAVHRASGRIFVVACLVAAPSGFVLAVGTVAGPFAAVGFAIPALLWPLFTFLGVRAVLERRIDDHREWMLRSYAVTANAITLRLLLPASGLLGFSFLDAYPVIAWLGWIMNLAGVEYYIRRNRVADTPVSGLATA
jgi:uncharacterized membrane protein